MSHVTSTTIPVRIAQNRTSRAPWEFTFGLSVNPLGQDIAVHPLFLDLMLVIQAQGKHNCGITIPDGLIGVDDVDFPPVNAR